MLFQVIYHVTKAEIYCWGGHKNGDRKVFSLPSPRVMLYFFYSLFFFLEEDDLDEEDLLPELIFDLVPLDRPTEELPLLEDLVVLNDLVFLEVLVLGLVVLVLVLVLFRLNVLLLVPLFTFVLEVPL